MKRGANSWAMTAYNGVLENQEEILELSVTGYSQTYSNPYTTIVNAH